MKNQINISNLTPEQIEEIREQLKAYDEKPKTIMDKVKSWEDAFELITKQDNYYINIDSEVIKIGTPKEVAPFNKNVIPSEKHAKSILSACQLMVIAEVLNEGIKPDWEYSVITASFGTRLVVETNFVSGVRQISFKSKELAEYAMTQFEDLWYDYLMIDKVNK